MNVLRRLPFLDAPSTLKVAGDTVAVRPYQIVVWVSLTLEDALPEHLQLVPAILDTGHNHNFSIRASQLIRWAGIHPDQCSKVGAILVNRQEVPLLVANLWIHRNRSGTTDLLAKPIRLPVPGGISVYPEDAPNAPRLPHLGLRGLVRNGWRLLIEGTAVSLSQKAPKRGKIGPG